MMPKYFASTANLRHTLIDGNNHKKMKIKYVSSVEYAVTRNVLEPRIRYAPSARVQGYLPESSNTVASTHTTLSLQK